MLFHRNARVDGFNDLNTSKNEKHTHLRLVWVVGGITTKGRARTAVGNDCGNGAELRGGAAVEGGGEGKVYSFHFFLDYIATMFWMGRSEY